MSSSGQLLDPAAWREGLEKYAQAMHLAVALVDAEGRLLGPCLNPRPMWRRLRAGRPAADGECPFALAPLEPCACVADALKKGAVVRATDRTGLVHFAVPLALGGQQFGALVAGQVFDRYPEQLPLEQVAKRFGLSPAEVWQTARLEHPVGPSMLRVYEDLLAAIGQAFLQGRYHTLREASRLAELRRAEEALRTANADLERRVAERTAALEEAQKKSLQAERLAAIGQVAAGLAHESRNALQRSHSCLEMLAMEVQNSPRALDLLQRLQASQDHLQRLYEQVREYAAPILLEPRPCALPDVWRTAWEHLEPKRQGRHAVVREEVGDVDPRCLVDAFRLGQVFRNILDNALAAASDPVDIVIACSPAVVGGREAIRVTVRDNGPGLDPEQRRRIFEPFYTTKTQGTGLGMAIARRIIEAHNGQITVGGIETPGAEIVMTIPREFA